MGCERRGQHVSKLVLHAKQVYLMAQGLNPSSSTPSDTFLTNTQPSYVAVHLATSVARTASPEAAGPADVAVGGPVLAKQQQPTHHLTQQQQLPRTQQPTQQDNPAGGPNWARGAASEGSSAAVAAQAPPTATSDAGRHPHPLHPTASTLSCQVP
jgi:hypothetical protein